MELTEEMRTPAEIRWFERIMIAAVVLSLLLSWEMWLQLSAFGGPLVLLIVLTGIAVPLGLTFAISRRRSSLARWVVVCQFALSLPLVIKVGFEAPASVLVPVAGMFFALCLLFAPASRRWFNAEA